mmetsp:Transcript_8659/g.35042  ORF Transcript_8659/g.35042 Transcript_8659/m.35042 type:complete len:258 (+) Transcript_8659:692-1465(+)
MDEKEGGRRVERAGQAGRRAHRRRRPRRARTAVLDPVRLAADDVVSDVIISGLVTFKLLYDATSLSPGRGVPSASLLSRPTRLGSSVSSVLVPLERGSFSPVRLRVLPRHLEYLSNPFLPRVARVREVLEQGERAGVAANLVRRRRAAQHHGLETLHHGDGDGRRVSLVHERVEPPGRGAKVARQRPQRLHHGKDLIVRIARAQTAVRQRFLDDHLHPRLPGVEKRGTRGLLQHVPGGLDAVEESGPVRRRHRHGLS